MNEVEEYLRKSGKWHVAVNTDWLGRAVQGQWWPNYYSQWLDTHDAERKIRGHDEFRPGGWANDDKGRQWWLSDTPAWDRQWFRAQGVRPPKRFTDRSRTYWKDYGGGLSKLMTR
jgi:hypothetical protein